MGNIQAVYGNQCCAQSDDEQQPDSNQDPPSPALIDEENKSKKTSLELTKAQLIIPTLKDFKLISLIGRGSFANVYLAQKTDSQEFYALKILSKELIRKKNQKYHTQTERILLEQLKHPFIVTLHYAFQSATELYFAMEFMQGGELFFHLKQSNKFTEKKAKFYAAELILAIEYLHANNVIYRDLKPENILLGADGHLKITDFGLSKMGIGIDEKTYTFCGSPHYLAPEIIQMLSGEPPFYGTRNELFNQIIEKPVEMKQYFSQSAKDLLFRLLQQNVIILFAYNLLLESLKNDWDMAPEIQKRLNLIPFFEELIGISLRIKFMNRHLSQKLVDKMILGILILQMLLFCIVFKEIYFS